MLLNHVGILNKSEEDAFRFYRDFLGFELTKEYIVPADLSDQLFALSGEIKMLSFEREGVKVEVFIFPGYSPPSPDIRHFGLLFDNFTEMVDKARASGIDVVIGRKEDKTVYFLKDYSGNLIEIKQK